MVGSNLNEFLLIKSATIADRPNVSWTNLWFQQSGYAWSTEISVKLESSIIYVKNHILF